MTIQGKYDEQFDRAVGRALEQVPLPVGLAERLLAVLEPDPDLGRPRDRRRRWLIFAPLAACLVLALGVGWYATRRLPPVDLDAVVDAFVEQAQQGDGPGVGALRSQDPAPPEFASPTEVKTNALTRWRAIHKIAGRNGVVYELSNERGHRATLFVVDLESRTMPIANVALPSFPPPGTFTAGWTRGAWTDGERLFVLVVKGNQDVYQSFVRPHGGIT